MVLKLEVIPLVNSNDEITLQIALVSDDVIGNSEPIEGIGSVPIIGTREILTTVTVPNNQTVILGGLITTNNKKNKSGIPILSSIPGIGRLFSTVEDSVSRDELLVFIQPSIVNSDATLDALQVDTDVRYDVSEEARRFADGPGLLPLPNEIEITEEKGRVTTRRTFVVPNESTPPAERRSLRPVHRR